MTTTRANAGAGRTRMSLSARIYVGAVVAAGALALVTSAPRELPQPTQAAAFLAAMIVVSLFKVRLPLGDGHSTMSMAYVVDFASIATAGVELAMLVAAAGVVVQCTARARRRQPWYRTAFSVAAVVLGVRTAGLVWVALGGSAAPGTGIAALTLVAAAAPYFAINSGLVAGAIAMSSMTSPIRVWRQYFAGTAPGIVAAAGMVGVVELMLSPDAYTMLAIVAVPATLCHLVYAAWFRRLTPGTPLTA